MTELSQEKREKLAAWLNEKSNRHNCPVCDHNDWIIAPQLVSPNVFSNGSVIIGGGNIPMALVICRNCAYTRQFAAVPIGLVDEEPKGSKSNE